MGQNKKVFTLGWQLTVDMLVDIRSIMTTRKTGGLLWGYKPLLLNLRLKALILLRKILVLFIRLQIQVKFTLDWVNPCKILLS